MPRPASAGNAPGRRHALLQRASVVQAAQNVAQAWGPVCEVDREEAIRSGRALSTKRGLMGAHGRAPLFVADVSVQNAEPVVTRRPKKNNSAAVAADAFPWLSALARDHQSKKPGLAAKPASARPASGGASVASRVRHKFGKLWRPQAFIPSEQIAFQQQLSAVARAAARCESSMLSDTEGEYFRRSFGIDPEKLTHFFKELDQFAHAIQISTTNRSYRRQYPEDRLCYFFQRVPCYSQLGSGAPSLPVKGFAPQTVMLALSNFPWRFVYNGQRIKLCDCTGGECDMPLDNRFKATMNTGVNAERTEKRAEKYVPEDQRFDARGSVAISMLTAVTSGRRSVFEQPDRQLFDRGGNGKISNRKDLMSERHLPQQLVSAAKTVRMRFSTMCKQLMSQEQELQDIWQPTQGSPAPTTEEWDRYMVSMTTTIQIFDQDYTKFERLYLELMDQMISLAKAPLKNMAEHSKLVKDEPNGYYDPIQGALLCQRLGLLNRRVDLGGRRVLEFDPALLEKARRAQRIDTFPVIKEMATELLDRFDELCQLLTDLDEEQVRPELRDIGEFREAVVALEEIWDWCRHVFSQQALDFIHQMIETLEELTPSFRRQIYRATTEDVDLDEEEKAAAEDALHTTLPIVIYISEMHRDVFGQPGRAGRDNGIFRSLFGCCSKTYQRLRSEIGKFDERRFQTLFDFIINVSEGKAIQSQSKYKVAKQTPKSSTETLDPKQVKYFENLFRQLKEAAAFSSEYEASATASGSFKQHSRSSDAKDQWLVLHDVVQKVAPHLFGEKRRSQRLSLGS